ncbi:MAG: DUF5667 domain-containing protein [Anaerolineaceae bacterium]|nr:DUF5667 domain-containing protein [Anaerolineaceae bacterium]
MSAKLISIVLSVMIAISGTGMGTVAASQSSLPNEVLYSVKQWSENTRLELTTNPEKEFDLHLELADRRVDEFVEMLEEGNTPPKRLLQQYQQSLQLAAQLADETNDPLGSRQELHDRMQNQEQQMEMVQSIDPLLQQIHQALQQQLELIECEDGEDCEIDLDDFDLDDDYDEDSDNDSDDDFDNDSDEDSDEDTDDDSDNDEDDDFDNDSDEDSDEDSDDDEDDDEDD